MIGKILLAVDGSQHALRATNLAAELAKKLDAELLIIHVLMHGRPSAELVQMAEIEHLIERAHAVVSPSIPYVSRGYLEALDIDMNADESARLISALGDEIVASAKTRSLELGARAVKTSVQTGDYAEAILDIARKGSVDMIVIGSRGLGSIKSIVLGSVSQKVLHHAECAVLTVR